MTIEVAIPSYARAETLATKTLPMLADGGVDAERITVFVADAAQADGYRDLVDPTLYGEIVVVGYEATSQPDALDAGPYNLGVARNFIARHYDRGTPVFQIDDDLRGFVERVDEKTARPIAAADVIDRGFRAADRLGFSLWGVYAVRNPYFMKPRVRTDLCYVCGGAFGFRATSADHALVRLDDKEDFERSIRWYLAEGGVCRLDDVAMMTEGYAGAGGMQETRSSENIDASARWLVAEFPDLASLNTTKKSGKTEVRLRDRRGRR